MTKQWQPSASAKQKKNNQQITHIYSLPRQARYTPFNPPGIRPAPASGVFIWSVAPLAANVPPPAATLGDLSPNLEALLKSMIWRAGHMQTPQSFSTWRCTARFGGRSHSRVPRLQPDWNSPCPACRANRLRLFGQDGNTHSACSNSQRSLLRLCLCDEGILRDSACRFPARVEFQAVFRKKPTPVLFAFAAMALSCH